MEKEINSQLKRATRGVRNCNPLNIKYSERNKWQGKVPDREKKDQVFEEFRSMEYGLRAALKLITKYCLEGTDTPRAIVKRWAPAGVDGNPTKAYVAYVEKRMELLLVNEWKYALDFDPKRRISYTNRTVINALLTAMSEFESRYTPTDFELSQAWKLV